MRGRRKGSIEGRLSSSAKADDPVIAIVAIYPKRGRLLDARFRGHDGIACLGALVATADAFRRELLLPLRRNAAASGDLLMPDAILHAACRNSSVGRDAARLFIAQSRADFNLGLQFLVHFLSQGGRREGQCETDYRERNEFHLCPRIGSCICG